MEKNEVPGGNDECLHGQLINSFASVIKPALFSHLYDFDFATYKYFLPLPPKTNLKICSYEKFPTFG